jgi:hypothetical protein
LRGIGFTGIDGETDLAGEAKHGADYSGRWRLRGDARGRKRGGGEPKMICDKNVKKWLENEAFLRGRRSNF